ncbi:Vms1/Ankzf1 family peptidyl-tRNA hydrolase [Nocardia sp. BMG51109]|uniref:Rv2629 family ribosome hibernation factor n=1 Tax=Nocardia sp. BMG51109 TaxID=1056816 RepID=UPI000463F303|nr:Vms1/Ankzf1 family peptidyl-tRNA hydrolase [Nocardia sp. BMG51109]
MAITSLYELTDYEGPFASVYLGTSNDTEDAAQQQRLRRRAVRAELTESGAPARILEAVDEALAAPPPGRAGQAVITDHEHVLVAEPLPVPPPRPVVRLSPLPYLLPLLELRRPRTPYVVAIVDRHGADIRGVDARGHRIAHSMSGTAHPLHKVGGGGPSHKSIQHRVEDTVRHNIAGVAHEVGRTADRAGATLVLLCGEVTARTALADALPPHGRRVIQVESGSRAAGSDRDALDRDIERILREETELRRGAVVELFGQEQGRMHGLAAQGLAATTAALREANADTLIVAPDALGDRVVCADPDPTQVMPAEMAPPRAPSRRADEALPLAALAARADIVITGPEHAPAEGVGALLRHG